VRQALIIDDNTLVRSAISLLLRSAGYDVLEAGCGERGQKIHADNNVDLLITDIFMDGGGGIETIRKFRATMPEIKIVAISGGGTLDGKNVFQLAETAGADATFCKPFDNELFLSKVAELLDDKT